jgi:hypothetical protein
MKLIELRVIFLIITIFTGLLIAPVNANAFPLDFQEKLRRSKLECF